MLRSNLEFEPSQIDLEIVRRLQAYGRASYRDIAKAARITERAVSNRIAYLREKGAIEVTIVADPRRLGYSSMALLGIRCEKGISASTLAEELFSVPGIDYAVTAIGQFDIVAEIVARSDAELIRTIATGIRDRKGVADVVVFPFLRLHYQQLFWDAAQAKKQKMPSTTGADLDKVDWGLIGQLSDDGRKSFLDIARLMKVSESHIRVRYNRLVDSGLIRVIALTNPKLLGYSTSAWVFLRVKGTESVVTAADKLASLPYVTYVAICSGGYDLVAEVICGSKDELLSFIDQEVRQLCVFEAVETLICYEFLFRKVTYERIS